MDAMYLRLPKKHIPTLFHSCALLGVLTAATRYLMSAASMSLWSWMIDPAAKIVFASFGSTARELPRYSKAL